MLTVSTRTLKIFATITWYIGGLVLLLKGGSLLIQAAAMKPGQSWPWLAVMVGLFIGGVKAKFIFSKSCRKNLERITSLNQPKAWLFFRPSFFVFMICMILFGATLSRMAQGHYIISISVGILDISIGTALLGSSHIFWRQKVSVESYPNDRKLGES